MLTRNLRATIFSLMLPVAAHATGVDIPVVPLSVMKDNVPAPLKSKPAIPSVSVQANNQSTQPLPYDSAKEARSRLVMTPGVNEIVAVAQNHLNRIVTPFDTPKVTTTSAANTEIRENVIYIGTNAAAPVTLYVTEENSEDVALSLTLIPKLIPPREIFLTLAKDQQMAGYATTKAKKWEQSQPYLQTIESLFRKIALGEVPPGYNLQKSSGKPPPLCRQAGLTFDFSSGQSIVGHNLNVMVGVARNSSPHTIEVVEEMCGNWNVAAVAAFPHNVLEPGQSTEVYVALRRQFKEEVTIKRPSLLGGQ